MKDYTGEITVGMKLIYDGEVIRWCNRNGRVVGTMNKGKYIVSRVSSSRVWVKADRKNATTEHCFSKDDLNRIGVLEMADMTTSIGMLNLNVFNRRSWYINDERLIAEAKKYNKSR